MRILACLCALGFATGCVTVAEFRKLERRVHDQQRNGGATRDASGERVADLAAQLASLERELASLSGRVEAAEHGSKRALEEARAARSGAAAASKAPVAVEEPVPPEEPEIDPGGAGSQEVQAYRSAYAAWRNGDLSGCVDRFRNFLQTYASSAYADDAAYWLADCYFKQGDYKTAVLRFDDVVARYPSGNKAPDALYRQGEALLRLGPGYGKAAGKAFERVLQEYPDSARAPEARKQLELLGAG